MEDTQIRLAAIWVALMLTYLLGDVLRIFAGDFKPGEISGSQATAVQWMAAAVINAGADRLTAWTAWNWEA